MRLATGRWQGHVMVGGAGVLLVTLALLPLLWPLVELVGGEPGEISRGLTVFSTPRPWILLVQSLALASAVVCGALLLGTPLGLLLARTDIAGRRILLLIHAFPLFLPPYLLVLGWFYLFGRQGFLGGEKTAHFLFHSFGYVATLSLAFAPLFTLLVALGLWNLDPSLEEAARVVARPARVLTGVLLPAARPSMALAGILVFALSLSELGVPMFLRLRVYPAAVFSRLGGIAYNPGEAFLLALPLIPIALILVALERRLFSGRPSEVMGLRNSGREPLPLGAWRGVLSVVCWGLTALSLLPLAALMARAGRGNGFGELGSWVGGSLVNSLLGAGIAATGIVALGAVLGHAYARNLQGARILDWVSVLAFVTPAVLLGIGFIALWNRPSTQFIYGGIAIMVFGYMARYGIIGIRTVAVAVAQSPLSLEETAATFGAGFLRRFFFVVLPLHRKSLGAAWLLAAVFCLRDLEMAVLFYPPGLEPLTVRIFTLEANGPEAVVAGLATLQVGLTGTVLGAGALFLTRLTRQGRV